MIDLVNARARNISATEVLDLRHLPDDGLAFDEALPLAWVTERVAEPGSSDGLAFEAREDGHVRMEVRPLGPMESRPPIQLRGTVRVALRTDCVRCLSALPVDLEAELDLTLMPAHAPASETGSTKRPPKPNKSAAVEDWSELEIPALEALDEGAYVGERLELPSILAEAVLLAMSMNPTCEDTPACDARTAALIEEANRAPDEPETQGDPRWAALKKLAEVPEED